MDRRTFIGAVAAAMTAAPLAASAQTGTTVRRIGHLTGGLSDTPDEAELQAAPLRARGWVEFRNLLIERRYAERAEDLGPMAQELVQLKVEIIVAWGTDAVLAGQERYDHHPHRHWFRRRSGRQRSRREPRPARRQYHRLFHCCPRARGQASRPAARVAAGLATRAATWTIPPGRITVRRAPGSSRRAGHWAWSRSLSKSPRQTSWRRRSRRWLGAERRL